jgi:serine/threonine protein kinase
MNFLHSCSTHVVHRDLKPSNVLLTTDNHIKITDFGLSKFIPSKNKGMNDKFAMTGETGSYRFMAPEVFRHEAYNLKVNRTGFVFVSVEDMLLEMCLYLHTTYIHAYIYTYMHTYISK